MPPVGERHEDFWLSKDVAEVVSLEIQIVDDALPQHPEDLRPHGNCEAGDQFLVDAGATDAIAALQHSDGESVLRQISRGNKAVVACTDHHCIIGVPHVVPCSAPKSYTRAASPG